MDKLLPCPFCGGEAYIKDLDGVVGNGHKMKFAACSSLDCQASIWCEDQDDTTARWNRRSNEANNET